MLEFDEGWRLFAGQIGDDLSLLDLQERASVLGVELRRFVDVARRFDDNWDLLGLINHAPASLSELDLSPLLARIASLGELAGGCLDSSDRLAGAILAVASAATDHLGVDPLTQMEWLEAVSWPARNAGRKGNWIRIDVEEVRNRVEEVRDQVAAEIGAYRQEVISHYVARVASFVEERVASRQVSGELAFHDLLVLARRLLRSNPQVRERLHQRYSRILLDEFQDTDPIQIELAVLLAATDPVTDQPWQELAAGLSGGRLVVVGDPKQSIYRFRRADMGVYSDAERALGAEPTRLTTNFRSVPGIVAWVNSFFEQVMGDGDPGRQPGYAPLSPHRQGEPGGEVPVVVLGGPHDRSVPVGEIREIEAADVAALVCRAIEEEWHTERAGHWLPLRLQDIAVLIPSRLSLPAIESAFSEANIPFRPETNSLVYATQEVRDVLAGVRAVVDPSSSIDVVAALRSSLFCVGDDDLLTWHLGGGPWDYRVAGDRLAPELAGHPVAAAVEVLAGWHRDRWWTEPSALIDRMVRERRLREAALAEARPRDRWRRYRFLAEQAREFTATKGGDLHDFVAWVELQASDLARVTEPIPAEPDDDAVRVLTVHGSKGLEFPMVVLAGAPTMELNRSGGPQVLFPPGDAPEVKLSKDASTQRFDLHASVEEVLDRYERIRLHYVAATRARDILALSAHHKEGIASGGRRTWEGLEGCAGLWRRFERRGDEIYRIEPPTQLRLVGGSHAEIEDAWRDEQDRLLAGSARLRTWSATALAERLAPQTGTGQPVDPGASGGEPDGEQQPWRRGRAGTAVGSAVHATLQVIDFAAPDGLDELAVLNAEREGIAERAAEVAALVRVALRAPSLDLARSNRHWRELYVSAPVGGALVEGFIDLCIELQDGLVIVDYKTDPVSGEHEIAAKLDRYRIQGAAYALALETIMGREVAGCRFVFIGPDEVIERSLPDLAGAKGELISFLSGQ
jgi:ATP-dependent exoDNAse (exonuclease V) beta subunit